MEVGIFNKVQHSNLNLSVGNFRQGWNSSLTLGVGFLYLQS